MFAKWFAGFMALSIILVGLSEAGPNGEQFAKLAIYTIDGAFAFAFANDLTTNWKQISSL